MSECLKCGQEIGSANYCGCGWKRAKAEKPLPEPTVQCAYMACHKSALYKVKIMANAWSNYCEQHYLEFHQCKVDENCLALKLATVEQKRAWVKNAVNKLTQKMRPVYHKDDEAA